MAPACRVMLKLSFTRLKCITTWKTHSVEQSCELRTTALRTYVRRKGGPQASLFRPPSSAAFSNFSCFSRCAKRSRRFRLCWKQFNHDFASPHAKKEAKERIRKQKSSSVKKGASTQPHVWMLICLPWRKLHFYGTATLEFDETFTMGQSQSEKQNRADVATPNCVMIGACCHHTVLQYWT